jgi:hypothetical protein
VRLPNLEEQALEQEDLEKGFSQEPVQETSDVMSLRRTPLPYFQDPESAYEEGAETQDGPGAAGGSLRTRQLSFIQETEVEHDVQEQGGQTAEKVDDVTSLRLSRLPYLQEAEAEHKTQEQGGQGVEQKRNDVTSLRLSPLPYLQEADDIEQGDSCKQGSNSLTPRSRALPYLMN